MTTSIQLFCAKNIQDIVHNMATKKYPAHLGRPKRLRPNNAIADVLYEAERSKREVDLLDDLCQHYRIDSKDRHRWFFLALHLARDHVPAFQVTAAKNVGRPRNRRKSTLDGKRKVGRPRTPDSDYQLLLNMVNATIEENGLSGRGAIKSALEIALTRVAESFNRPKVHWFASRLKSLQKEYSYAAKLFPAISYKYKR